MYKVVRRFFRHPGGVIKRTIKSGLTLEQARSHCSNPETSSRTATSSKRRAYIRKYGEWFDGYEECKR